MKRLLPLLLFVVPAVVFAQNEQPADLEALPVAPPPPAPVVSGEALEPEVTIIRTQHEIIEEYRVDGVIRMVKITPRVGPAYFLVDTDGDGQLDVTRDSIYNASTNMWQILTWD